MKKNLQIGQCFKVTLYRQTHYYKVLELENGQYPFIDYVSFYGDGIYVGKSRKTLIDDNAEEITEEKFDSIRQKVTTELLPIVEHYMSYQFNLIEDTTQYVNNIPLHPKGQCYLKIEEGSINVCKLANPYKYGDVTAESFFVCLRPDCFGLYLFLSSRVSLGKAYKEIDKKDYTKLKRYTTNITRPAMWALMREFQANWP